MLRGARSRPDRAAARARSASRARSDGGRPGQHRTRRCSSTSSAASASPAPRAVEPDEGLVLLRSAGERGEAEAIGGEVARLLARRRRARTRSRSSSATPAGAGRCSPGCSSPTASPSRSRPSCRSPRPPSAAPCWRCSRPSRHRCAPSDLLRLLRGPSGLRPQRPGRLARAHDPRSGPGRRAAAEALELWERGSGRAALRPATGCARQAPASLAAAVGETATRMALRFRRRGRRTDRRRAGRRDRAAGRRRDLDGARARSPSSTGPGAGDAELIDLLARPSRSAPGSGPIEGRVRIADPQRLRAGRFDHVFDRLAPGRRVPPPAAVRDPFLSEAQRESLGLRSAARGRGRGALPLLRPASASPGAALALSYRDSDEAGAALARSPFLDDVRHLLAPPPGRGRRRVERRLTRDRGLADVVHPPSRGALRGRAGPRPARLADRGRGGRGAAATQPREHDQGEGRGAARGRAGGRGRDPGARPDRQPAPCSPACARSRAYGGTTLEDFDLCSYRWFIDHELNPQPLDPTARRARPGRADARGPRAPLRGAARRHGRYRPGHRSPAWEARGPASSSREQRRASGSAANPAERRDARRVEGLLSASSPTKPSATSGGFEPELLEARFGERTGRVSGPLEIDGWRLHGSIDRVDVARRRPGAGPRLQVSRSRSPLRREARGGGKLQLQLYLLAPASSGGREPVGGLYLPLRGDHQRRPRGLVLRQRGRPPRPRPRRHRPAGGRSSSRRCSTRRARGPGRSSPACAKASPPRPRPRAGQTTTSAPPTATSRRSAAGSAARATTRTAKRRSGERAHARPRSRRRRSGRRAATSWSRRAPAPARPGCWSTASAGWSATTESGWTRSSPSPSPSRPRPSSASGSAPSSLRRAAGDERRGELLRGTRAAPGSRRSTASAGACSPRIRSPPGSTLASGSSTRPRPTAPAPRRLRGGARCCSSPRRRGGEPGDRGAAYLHALRAIVISAHDELRSRGEEATAATAARRPTLPRRSPSSARRPPRRSRSWRGEPRPARLLERGRLELLAERGRRPPGARRDRRAAQPGARRRTCSAYQEAAEAATARSPRPARAAPYRHAASLSSSSPSATKRPRSFARGLDFEDLQLRAATCSSATRSAAPTATGFGT